MTTSLSVLGSPVERECKSGKCGACCRTMSSPPLVGKNDDRRLTKAMKKEIAEYLDGENYDPEGPCLWYDRTNNRCKNYDQRPDVCRDFVPGEVPCFYNRYAQGVGTKDEHQMVEKLAEMNGVELNS